MPLSDPALREKLHIRAITLHGYRRTDGLYDVDAEITDTKTYGFDNSDRPGGRIEAGEKLHCMVARITFDEELLIHAAEAATEYGPFASCPGGAASFAKLAGLPIRAGFLRAANERMRGVAGCTHLRELLQQMATVAYQTMYPMRRKREDAATAPQTPRLLNSCFAYASDGPAVKKRWPHAYTGPHATPPPPREE